ncbi:PUF domain-containing protein [Cephalotus follicularis]|uniref:PUF domain-containing protein n=1 Tax=Cephalotus follicularis TaxID=3775 RepID=A0A1Q3D1G4_CEPFO|nr:PUF domain-containing protein [Cephalotus follicularis]
MEDGRTELEFDEFEKLLGEIPNATSANSHSEEFGPKRVSLNGSLSPSCKGPLPENLQNNESLDGGKRLAKSPKQSPFKRVQLGEATLPDEPSLTSKFVELNFNDGVPMDFVSPPVAKCKSSPDHGVLLDCQYPSCLNNSISTVGSRVMVVPSFHSPTNGFAGQESSYMSRHDAQELKKMQVSYCQPNENFSTALPLAHGVQGYPFFPNVPVPGEEFHLMTDQQRYFVNTQSGFPYLHSRQLNHPHIAWSHVEEEQYYLMHQQHLILQQLRNQRLEGQHPIQANGNVSTRLINQNMRQSCYASHKLEQSNQEPFWNNYAIPRGLNQSNSAFSSSDYNAMHVLDKVGKQSFPEKILTRSNGLNTLKAVKFGSIGGNEMRTHLTRTGKVLPNGRLHHSLCTSNSGCFQLDSLSSSPDTTHFKSSDSKSLPQKYNSLDEVTGRIYLMGKDQHGCRFLQRKFSEGTREDVEKIFTEIIDHIVELMTDPFGNYLVQKLLEVCNDEQRMQILQAITIKAGDLVEISCDMHGTRAVQKVIETLTTPEQFSIVVSSLKPGIVTLIKNMNGNHVAQRCLQYLMPEYSKFLFEAATTYCVELATDRHGCCVLQKCLSYSEGEQRRRLVRQITSNALILCQDPFGNYVVQFVFELRLPWAMVDILDQLEGNYGDLSMQKYSSNVVEKCLKYAGEERRSGIIQELINNAHLDQVMQDPYGNYVIQAALQQSKGALHTALVDAIRPHVPVLRTSPYGKKVLSSNGLKK